jgi:uncharacterized lipoprotein YehR (DUF1307 family)
MKKIRFLISILFASILLTGCDTRLNTSDLTVEVQKSMEETFAGKGIVIESLIITRVSEDSNQYKGVLNTNEPNGKFVYTVDVTYDGESFTWQTTQ